MSPGLSVQGFSSLNMKPCSCSLVVCSRLAFLRATFSGKVLRIASTLPDGDDLAKVELIIIHLGDEDGCHGLVESSAVHVDGGPDGQHEADDAPVDVVVL